MATPAEGHRERRRQPDLTPQAPADDRVCIQRVVTNIVDGGTLAGHSRVRRTEAARMWDARFAVLESDS